MMLTPIKTDRLPEMIRAYDVALAVHPAAQTAFRRIAQSGCEPARAAGEALHAAAINLATRIGMAVLDVSPSDGFSWDGQRAAVRTEPAVLIHEVAHWLIAPVARRRLPDFGLGAGPETGCVAEADAACCVDDATKEREEGLASLLGILWEVEFGGPAIDAFCEQNWFELYDRPGTQAHFVSTLEELRHRGLIDAACWPIQP